MTQEEFYLKAMLALASNPSYVEVKRAEDDPSVTTHVLLTEEIQMDAERLLNEAKDSWDEAFDRRSDNENFVKMAEALDGLDKEGIKAYCQIDE